MNPLSKSISSRHKEHRHIDLISFKSLLLIDSQIWYTNLFSLYSVLYQSNDLVPEAREQKMWIHCLNA